MFGISLFLLYTTCQWNCVLQNNFAFLFHKQKTSRAITFAVSNGQADPLFPQSKIVKSFDANNLQTACSTTDMFLNLLVKSNDTYNYKYQKGA